MAYPMIESDLRALRTGSAFKGSFTIGRIQSVMKFGYSRALALVSEGLKRGELVRVGENRYSLIPKATGGNSMNETISELRELVDQCCGTCTNKQRALELIATIENYIN
ncbi:hypothetical protein DMW20_11950 [Vibrio parahaemolyticus]|nr:hypothetical protein [Vibrio parahaemolyticus]